MAFPDCARSFPNLISTVAVPVLPQLGAGVQSLIPGVLMGSNGEQRRILVIGADAWVRDTIRVLLGSMGCQCAMASNLPQALPMLEQENPGAAILDGQPSSPAALDFSGIDELCLRLRDHVIILTRGGLDPDIPAVRERWWLPRVRRERLLLDLWGSIHSLLHPNAGFRRVTLAARLVFDSSLQPLPAGIRAWESFPRRCVYEAGSLMVDISLDPQPDSRDVVLVGQLLDSAKPQRPLDTLAVGLRGPKGTIARAATNKFGEFHLNFAQEPGVNLEIETGANERVLIILPGLEGMRKGAASAGG